jgi:hypothetical protein
MQCRSVLVEAVLVEANAVLVGAEAVLVRAEAVLVEAEAVFLETKRELPLLSLKSPHSPPSTLIMIERHADPQHYLPLSMDRQCLDQDPHRVYLDTPVHV